MISIIINFLVSNVKLEENCSNNQTSGLMVIRFFFKTEYFFILDYLIDIIKSELVFRINTVETLSKLIDGIY